jgi:hypothetical protein
MGERPLPEAQNLLQAAMEREAEAHRLLMSGDRNAARVALTEAAVQYRRSWEAAPPRAFGRLVGMLKAAVIAGEGPAPARYALRALGTEGDSPTSWYAIGLAALIEDDDALAIAAARGMRDAATKLETGRDPFERAAEAVSALAYRNEDRYREAVSAILADFEQRGDHLTGVAIADTALMFEVLAERRGMGARPDSPLLPR